MDEQETQERSEQQIETGDEQQSGEPDKGFPDGTPVAEMTDAQRAAYYKHQNRKAESRLQAFKGVTPEQFEQMQTRIAELEAEKETADEKALREAKEAAAKEARDAAVAEFGPRLHRSQLKAAASQVLKGEQLEAWLDGVDPSKFVGESGDIDEAQVMGKLTALFGAPKQETRNWGQHGTTPPGETPGAGGIAEAEKRFGKKT